MTPDFDLAVQRHMDCIKDKDITAFKSHLTHNKTLYTIMQNGHALTTPHELADVHDDWFQQTGWLWEGAVVHKAVGTDMAMAVIKYSYRATAKAEPFETWLTYVFALEGGEWKIIHDQNTALDFSAFSKAMSESN